MLVLYEQHLYGIISGLVVKQLPAGVQVIIERGNSLLHVPNQDPIITIIKHESMFRLEVVLSVTFYDHVSSLNIGRWSGPHIMNVHESDMPL